VRERLNSYFGYPAVGAVRIVQQAIGAKHQAASKPVVERPIPAATETRLDGVDGPLRESLRVLARGILARS
jgi:hypothetical protein